MKVHQSVIFVCALLATTVGCATTSFVDTWRDPEAQPASLAGKTIVVAVQRADEAGRRSAEDALARRITERGGKGIASWTLGGDELRDSVVAKAKITATGAQGLLVMRIAATDTRTTTTTAPMPMDPYLRRPWGWYGAGWGAAYTPQTTTTMQIVTVETRVYSLERDRLVWAGTSRTSDPSRVDQLILEVARKAADEMRKEGLLAPDR